MSVRQVLQRDLVQGEDEEIVYSITTTPWGSSPSNVSVVAYDVTYGQRTEVTSTVLSGAASVTGDVITLPVLADLTEGNVYRIEVKFTAGGQIFEPYFIVAAEH